MLLTFNIMRAVEKVGGRDMRGTQCPHAYVSGCPQINLHMVGTYSSCLLQEWRPIFMPFQARWKKVSQIWPFSLHPPKRGGVTLLMARFFHFTWSGLVCFFVKRENKFLTLHLLNYRDGWGGGVPLSEWDSEWQSILCDIMTSFMIWNIRWGPKVWLNISNGLYLFRTIKGNPRLWKREREVQTSSYNTRQWHGDGNSCPDQKALPKFWFWHDSACLIIVLRTIRAFHLVCQGFFSVGQGFWSIKSRTRLLYCWFWTQPDKYHTTGSGITWKTHLLHLILILKFEYQICVNRDYGMALYCAKWETSFHVGTQAWIRV